MGYSSMDDFIRQVTINGNFFRQDWCKVNAAGTLAAKQWYLPSGAGTGGAVSTFVNGLAAGADLVFQSMCDATVGAITPGPPVSPLTRVILNASLYTAAATTLPATFVLVDILGVIPTSTATTSGNRVIKNANTFTCTSATPAVFTTTGVDMSSFTRVQLSNSGGSLPGGFSAATDYWTVRTGTNTTNLASSLDNAIAGIVLPSSSTGSGTNTSTILLPRYTDGKGVKMFVTGGGLGAATPTLQITYTNPAGTSGQVTPLPLPIGMNLSGVSGQAIVYAGNAATSQYAPFMPLAPGDNGILSVQDINLSTSYLSGTTSWILCKPLLSMQVTTAGIVSERDLMAQLPSMPIVQDHAYLAWIMISDAAFANNAPFYGHLDFGWA